MAIICFLNKIVFRAHFRMILSMIPRGICIDLETTITAKISDAIRGPGLKRFETRIIEIGACHWRDTSRQFMRLVNPITVPVTSGAALIQHLRDIHQKPTPTLNFWSRVLVKRKSLDRTMFSKEEDPNVWLARQPERRAEDFVRWFNGAHGPDFVSEAEALRDLLAWTGNQPWLAHNGNSFDFKVLVGCSFRTGVPIPKSIAFYDTLKLFRKHIPGHKSYSQPKLYEKIFSEKYNAHVAIDDSLALARLCVYCNRLTDKVGHEKIKRTIRKIDTGTDQLLVGSKKSIPKNTNLRKAMNLTFPKGRTCQPKKVMAKGKKIRTISQLQGVGPKSCQAFTSCNINSLDELFKRYNSDGTTWLKEILPYGVHWRRVERSIQTAQSHVASI